MIKRTFKSKCAIAIGLLLLFSSGLQAAPGDYDMSFGNGGIVTSEHNGSGNFLRVAQQPDGKLLVTWAEPLDNNAILRLRRHNADGSLDTTFGFQGDAVRVVSPTPQFVIGYPRKVLALPDGGIVVVGSRRLAVHGGGDTYRPAIWRFTASGLLDTSFSEDGMVGYSMPPSVHLSEACDVELGGSGRIYVAHSEVGSGFADSGITRLSPDGGFDSTFGSSGMVKQTSFTGCQIAVAPVRAGGHIYWAGTNKLTDQGRIFRYDRTGIPDGGFGSFGTATLSGTCFETGAYAPSALELQSDGKLAVAGSDFGSTPNFHNPFIARFNSNGVLDSSFSADGIIGCPRIDALGVPYLKVQSDNKIVMVNSMYLSSLPEWSFRRFLVNGSADFSFVPEGPPSESNSATDLLIQPDGKIVTVGQASSPLGYRLSRYLP